MDEQQFSSYQLKLVTLRNSTFRVSSVESNAFDIEFGWDVPEQTDKSISVELMITVTTPDEGITEDDFFIFVKMRAASLLKDQKKILLYQL